MNSSEEILSIQRYYKDQEINVLHAIQCYKTMGVSIERSLRDLNFIKDKLVKFGVKPSSETEELLKEYIIMLVINS